MKIAICDDNALCLREIQDQLNTIPLVNDVHSFGSLEDFLQAVRNGNKYDAALLDIEWNTDKTGIDAAEVLYEASPKTKIIYVTGFTDRFVQQIFLRKTNLSGYLTKPVDCDLLEAHLKKILQMSANDEDKLTIKVNGTLVSLLCREIWFMESKDHTVLIHTKQDTISIYEKLKNILEALPPNFIQCHKSFVVNMREIKRFQASEILLKNGCTVPVSRARYTETRNAFFTFMGKEL